MLSEEGTTQGDPLAMPMYALGTIPLINRLSGNGTQVWYADDATVCGRLSKVRLWWDRLVHIGPDFGYFPNPSKTCVIVKEQFYDEAVTIFRALEFQLLLRENGIWGWHLAHLHLLIPLKRKFPPGSGNLKYFLIFLLLILMLHMQVLFMVSLGNGIF